MLHSNGGTKWMNTVRLLPPGFEMRVAQKPEPKGIGISPAQEKSDNELGEIKPIPLVCETIPVGSCWSVRLPLMGHYNRI